MKIVDLTVLDRLVQEARKSPRGRQNLNLHDSFDEPCQRLLNAVEPESYIRPHRHLTPLKPEFFLAIRGRFAAVVFTDDGEIDQAVLLDASSGTFGVDIPAGDWHCILALEPGSVFFEAKPGPYQPISDKDWAPWAPVEGSREAEDYLGTLRGKILEGIKQTIFHA